MRGVSNTAHGHSTRAESLRKAAVATVGFFSSFLMSPGVIPFSGPRESTENTDYDRKQVLPRLPS